MTQPKKVNYLNNKDILKQIHQSKMTYCYVQDDRYNAPDIIVESVKKINKTAIKQAQINKAAKLSTLAYQEAVASGDWTKKPKQKEFTVDPKTMAVDELVFRVMTYDHVPDEPGRKRNPRNVADRKEKVNFPPFQHFKYDKKGNLVCVGKSHWEGGMSNGSFNKSHGMATNKLALMWMKLCERYGTRGNVRGYTYNDEMQGQAILQLAQIGLQFDESKSNNPFAYYTAAVTNSFVRIINIEKRNQNIRDDILEMNNMMPSMTRQTQGDASTPKKAPAKKVAKKVKK